MYIFIKSRASRIGRSSLHLQCSKFPDLISCINKIVTHFNRPFKLGREKSPFQMLKCSLHNNYRCQTDKKKLKLEQKIK